MSYRDELRKAMTLFGEQPRSIVIGQSVAYPGTGMTDSFADVPRDKLLELPIFENVQLGMAIGLSLAGELPLCVFPRINFALCAMDQLVLHLDAIPRYSAYRPKVIIRTAIGTDKPLDPGPQHTGEYAAALRMILKRVTVIQLKTPSHILDHYKTAIEADGSYVMVEYPEFYDAHL